MILSDKTRYYYLLAAAVLGWCALSLQLYLSLRLSLAKGMGTGEAIVRFLSYFTVLSNILAAIVLSIAFLRWPARKPAASVWGAVTVYIAIVGIVYSLLLRPLWEPSGLNKLADIALHDAMPAAFVVYWFLWAPKAGLRITDPVRWLVFPVLYIVFTLLRGPEIGWYPYPFVDAGALGPAHVAVNLVGLVALFLGMGAIVVAAARGAVRMRLA